MRIGASGAGENQRENRGTHSAGPACAQSLKNSHLCKGLLKLRMSQEFLSLQPPVRGLTHKVSFTDRG